MITSTNEKPIMNNPIVVTHREGDCWSDVELAEFSVSAVAAHINFDPQNAEGEEEITFTHVERTGMTIITYFDSDGESCDWIAPTSLFLAWF